MRFYEAVMIEFVAPLVGAWIEILSACKVSAILSSLLSWERGLKSGKYSFYLSCLASLLSWERGLKYLSQRVDKKEESRSSRGSVD